MPKFHIDEVHCKDVTCPLIINFQNGYTTDNFKTNNCGVFQNEKGENIVALELGKLIYIAKEEKEDLGKTLILSRNKKTGKVRLMEVGSVELKPTFKSDSNAVETLNTSYLELSRKFGSKKIKRYMELKEKHRVDADTVAEQMQKVTANVTEDTIDLAVYVKNTSDDFYVPPINRDAETVEQIYHISAILPQEEYQKIYSEIEGKDYTSDMHPWIKSIVSSKDLSPKHAVLAVYADTALKMYTMTSRDIVKRSFIPCPLSVTLSQICLDIFTVQSNEKRNRPTPYKDKALCYAVVFTLLINNYKFDLDSLCEHLKLTPTAASNKVRVTGASVVLVGNKKVVQLKIPLSTAKFTDRRKSAKF